MRAEACPFSCDRCAVQRSPPALACACCTQGQRNVATVALPASNRNRGLRFAGKATLFTGEADAGIAGIHAVGKLRTHGKMAGRPVLSFRDKLGHTGDLSMARPKTVSVFEVDPRDRPDRGKGPRSTRNGSSPPRPPAAACSGRASRRALLTLILQGGGNSCTSANDFSHWTLVMQGPKANYTLFGDLVTTK